MIALAFFVLKRTQNLTFSNTEKSVVLNIFKKVISIGLVFYFLSQSLLLYESIQNLFAHVLFYELPWTLFSLMLTAAVFFLAFTGIKNIALGFELYAFVIIVSYIIISIFGGSKADFASVLPFETIDFKAIGEGLVDFNLWFGDFFLVLFVGKNAKHIKFKWTALVYAVAMIFVTLLFVEFFGIYQSYTPMKPSLISVLSEQSMLGVNIGRIDWFFILFTEIGTILSSGAFLYFASKCLNFVFPKVKRKYLLVALTIAIYFIDIVYLVDLHAQKQLFIETAKYIVLALKAVVMVLLVAVALCRKKESKSVFENHNSKKQVLTKLKPVKLKQQKAGDK